MEIYVAYKDYPWMMDFTEEMLETEVSLPMDLQRQLSVKTKWKFKAPYARVPMLTAIKDHTGYDLGKIRR